MKIRPRPSTVTRFLNSGVRYRSQPLPTTPPPDQKPVSVPVGFQTQRLGVPSAFGSLASIFWWKSHTTLSAPATRRPNQPLPTCPPPDQERPPSFALLCT